MLRRISHDGHFVSVFSGGTRRERYQVQKVLARKTSTEYLIDYIAGTECAYPGPLRNLRNLFPDYPETRAIKEELENRFSSDLEELRKRIAQVVDYRDAKKRYLGKRRGFFSLSR